MYDDIAGVQITLEADGFEQLEACTRDDRMVCETLSQREGVDELLELRTCQRYELYAAGPEAETALASGLDLDLRRTDRLLQGQSAIEQLFRVACGLESGVLGEDEILGQLRNAYNRASEADMLGGKLDTIVLKALRSGERARTETEINEGTVSLGSVTADRIADLPVDGECTTLVVGAGDVATMVVKSIVGRNLGSVWIANRTVEPARALAQKTDSDAMALTELSDGDLTEVDVLVSATAAERRIFTREELDGRELFVFDLATPRDIHPAVEDCSEIELCRIDELLAVRNEGIKQREAAVPAVEAIIDEELDRLGQQLRAERIDDALTQIYSHSHELRNEEFEQALDRLDAEGEQLSETQRQVIADFSRAVVNKLLHPKTDALRQAAATGDRETVDAWLTLFDQRSDEQEQPKAPQRLEHD